MQPAPATNTESSFADLFWLQLLDLIEERRVIPVVGRDLLTMAGPGGCRTFYSYYAERLAVSLGVPCDNLPAGEEIGEVASRYLARSGDTSITLVYTALRGVVSQSKNLPLPEPLAKLAAITPFQIFVSTTFDSCLARAIDQARFAGQPRTRVVSFSPQSNDDLPEGAMAGSVPTVYHLLGKPSGTPSFAVTQWDMVEYFQGLLSETGRPRLLFEELNKRSILILGSSFGGWLARFFLRMAKGHPGPGIEIPDYIAAPEFSQDKSLALFIKRFKRGTEIYEGGGAVDFVDELHRRWMERHPEPLPPIPEPIPRGPSASLGEVFLSYAREDLPAAEKIRSALEDKQIDVFLDVEGGLEAGDEWERKIRRKIRECSLFLPLISRHTLTEDPQRFFRVEWRRALERQQYSPFRDDSSFLIPVSIDGTRPDTSGIPEEFSSLNWTELPGGQTTPAFVERIRQLYRKYQMSQR